MSFLKNTTIATLTLLGLAQTAGASEPKFLFEEDPTLLISNIQVVVRSGVIDDPKGKNGLSNLLAELMVRGTRSRSREQFQSEVERLGARLKVSVRHDMIIFAGEVIKENTLSFLSLLEDCILHPGFAKNEFESLKTELAGEIAHIKNMNGRLSGLALRRGLLEGTPLEKPSEGSLSTVKSITLADVQAAYKRQVTQGNLVFAVASSLKDGELKKGLDPIWKGLPEGATPQHASIELKLPKQPTLVVVHKPKTSTGSIMFGQAGIVAKDKYRYDLEVANFSFGGEPLVSRLFKTIRSQLGWTYSIFSTYSLTGALSNQQGFYAIATTPTVEFTSKTLLKVLEMWKQYLETGLSNDELLLARDSLINSYPFEFDSAQKRLVQKFHSYVYDVPLLNPEQYASKIGAIGNDDIKKALKERQAPESWYVTVVADADILAKQLQEEQKSLPKEKQLVISKRLTPDDIIR